MKLHEEDSLTIPLLVESYIDLDTFMMILHLVEKSFDFKAFIKPYIVDGNDNLVGRTEPQRFSCICAIMISSQCNTNLFAPHPIGAHMKVS